MPLSYLVDEDSRGVLGDALIRQSPVIDVVRVGDPDSPSLGTPDPEILRWAEATGRILISRDRSTLGRHLDRHLRSGRHSPGIFLIRPGHRVGDLADFLVDVALTTDPQAWADGVHFLP